MNSLDRIFPLIYVIYKYIDIKKRYKKKTCIVEYYGPVIYTRSNLNCCFTQPVGSDFLHKRVDIINEMSLYCWLLALLTVFTKTNVQIKGPAKLSIV